MVLSSAPNPFLDPAIPGRLLEDRTVLFVAIEADATITWVSESAEFLVGRTPGSLVGSSALAILHPDDHQIVLETMAEAARGSNERIRVALRAKHADGRWISLEFGGVDMRDADGAGSFLVWGSPHEPTGRLLQFLGSMLAGSALEHLLSQITEWHDRTTPGTRTSILVFETGRTYRCAAASASLPGALCVGLTEADLDEPPWRSLVEGGSPVWSVGPTQLPGAVAEAAVEAGIGSVWIAPVVTPRRREASAFVVLWRTASGPLLATQRRQIANTTQAVQVALEWSVHRSDLVRAATTDPLTGLANRTQLDARIRADRSPLAAVLFIDLDEFKQVNDRHGHLVGDRILRESARRLAGAIRPYDLLVRLGGDEFAVWCPNLRSANDAETVARRLVASLEDPVDVDGHAHRLGCSVGVAVVAADDAWVGDVDRILGAADQALYRAKDAGKGRWALDRDRPLPFPD